MPGWPDFLKGVAWTFPPTIGAANINSNFLVVSADTTSSLASYTDSKVHVLYSLSVVGSITNTDTANDKTPLFRVSLTRGFDNGGVAAALLTGSWHVATAVTGTIAQTVAITLTLQQPILFQAGSVATPNVLQFASTSGQTGYKAALGWTVIDWAVT